MRISVNVLFLNYILQICERSVFTESCNTVYKLIMIGKIKRQQTLYTSRNYCQFGNAALFDDSL